jgi:hypothetical protein
VARQFVGEASFVDIDWGQGGVFHIRRKVLRLSAQYTVMTHGGRPLFHIDRPSQEAVASELVAMAIPGKRYGTARLLGNLAGGTLVEHSMARSYVAYTPDNLVLGSIHKSSGLDPAEWLLMLPDGQLGARAMVHSTLGGSFLVRLLDPHGRVSLAMGRQRTDSVAAALGAPAGRMDLEDAWGRPVGAFVGTDLTSKVTMEPMEPPIFPLYPVFVALIAMYELDPTE